MIVCMPWHAYGGEKTNFGIMLSLAIFHGILIAFEVLHISGKLPHKHLDNYLIPESYFVIEVLGLQIAVLFLDFYVSSRS